MDTTADLSTAMLARIRKHALVTLLWAAAGIIVITTGPVVGDLAFDGAIPDWWRGLTLLVGIGMFPVIYVSTAFRYLRCPGCNGLVGVQVSGQASLWANRESKQCRHCGKTIFDGRFTRHMRIVQVWIVFGTILLFGILAFVVRGRS